MRASSPQIPSSKKEVERGPFTSSSSLKRNSAQREKLARKGLSVFPRSSNSQRDSCCVHDKWELVVSDPPESDYVAEVEVNGRFGESGICFDLHTQKIQRSLKLSLHATNTAMLCSCLCDITTLECVREVRARDKSLVSSWKAVQVDISHQQEGNKPVPTCSEQNIDAWRGHTDRQQRETSSVVIVLSIQSERIILFLVNFNFV